MEEAYALPHRSGMDPEISLCIFLNKKLCNFEATRKKAKSQILLSDDGLTERLVSGPVLSIEEQAYVSFISGGSDKAILVEARQNASSD